jgi:hypothetical protein
MDPADLPNFPAKTRVRSASEGSGGRDDLFGVGVWCSAAGEGQSWGFLWKLIAMGAADSTPLAEGWCAWEACKAKISKLFYCCTALHSTRESGLLHNTAKDSLVQRYTTGSCVGGRWWRGSGLALCDAGRLLVAGRWMRLYCESPGGRARLDSRGRWVRELMSLSLS